MVAMMDSRRFGDLVSTGVGIVFARETGAMRKDRADEIYGQGLIISIGMGLLSALLIFVLHVYTPNPDNKDIYERNYRVFKKLYKSNAGNFRALNS